MLTKTSLQIIKALVELARLPDGEAQGAACVAKKIKSPQNYLGKMLQMLAGEGMLVSQKGFNGGFRLAKRPDFITLFHVVHLVEDIGRWEGCFLGQSRCSSKTPCAVHNRWALVRDSFINFLKETTLQDLVNQEDSGRIIKNNMIKKNGRSAVFNEKRRRL